MQNQDSDVTINIGIDFGTRFTKVCFFSEELGAHVLNFGQLGLETSLLPSFVFMDMKGRLSISKFLPGNQEYCYIFNLKMAAMGLERLEVYSNSSLILGPTEEMEKCLAAFFMANVISKSTDLIKSIWHKKINGRKVIWSANVGIPVDYADSKLACRFQEILAVAWDWVENDLSEKSIADLQSIYTQSIGELEPEKSPCQTYPSIAAAFISFIESEGEKDGIYVYFEIGSRSIDGALLKLRVRDKETQIQFMSAASAFLGVDWIVEDICKNPRVSGGRKYDSLKVKDAILKNDSNGIRPLFLPYSEKIAKLVGHVIYKGKQKDYRLSWFDETSVKVFLGGGGGRANFYKLSVLQGYEKNGLSSYGIPYYSVSDVTCPQDLNLSGVATEDYHRFLVAYGLSRQLGKRFEFKLPSCFEVIDQRMRRKESEFEASNPGGHAVF